jgi:hypothetical protein
VDFETLSLYAAPSESYSRQLDKMVAAQEMPYGYTMPPPPADTGNYDMRALETDNQHRPKKGR